MDQGESAAGNDRRLVRIAVVDDDEDIVSVLGEVLQEAGYLPDLFASSDDARTAATSQEYDIIVADLQMPKVSGMDLLKQVKEVFPLTQFIMITGYACVRSAAEAMERGAISYLTKPLTSTQILAHVEKAAERRALTLDNQKLIFELSRTNETLEGKVQELRHTNHLLKQAQADLIRAERLAAIGEVVVSINHCVNNSLSGMKAAVRFIRSSGSLNEETMNALARIDDEADEIEAVIGRLRRLREAHSAEYVGDVKMINLDNENADVHA
jgi:FixJ family two-component response regulator